ncbi:MAG TPA: hypothetical protein VF297_27340 [Pyrinomonadaceae bacterium]
MNTATNNAAPGTGGTSQPAPNSGGRPHIVFSGLKFLRYRNYLLTIYAGKPGTSKPDPQRPADPMTHDKFKARLETRFHQNFDTVDETPQPANKLLIPIVKTILTAAKGDQHGFGVKANAIQPQGQKSDREYLDYLISLSGLSARDLGLRYRVDLERPDGVLSSPVEENIATLQDFYRDGFQCEPELYSIVPQPLHGNAPFFLMFDEWLHREEKFHGENAYQLRQTFRIDLRPEHRDAVREQAKENNAGGAFCKWFAGFIDIEEKVNDAHRKFDLGQFAMARERYAEAWQLTYDAIHKILKPAWGTEQIKVNGPEVKTRYAALKGLAVKNDDDVLAFQKGFQWEIKAMPGNPTGPYSAMSTWVKAHNADVIVGLLHLCLYALPTWLGDTALAVGDYAQAASDYEKAAGFRVFRAEVSDEKPYPDSASALELYMSSPYTSGKLPYSSEKKAGPYELYGDKFEDAAEGLAKSIGMTEPHSMEGRFFRLRHGNALLEWADALYRADDASSAARARELYKAVLWLHDETPPIVSGVKAVKVYEGSTENPALLSQKNRALKGFYQIEAGLNYYGFDDSLVPVLRYKPLKEAAERYAAVAKSAQQDFLTYMTKVEDAIRENYVTTNMLKKAELHGQIASEQSAIAQRAVEAAEQQVAKVEAAIKAKEKELAEHDGLGEQFLDLCEGMVDVISDLPSGVTDYVTKGGGAALAGSAGFSYGSAATGVEALSAGAGAAMAGYGVFVYAGVMGLYNSGSAQNQRVADLETLKKRALPAAHAEVRFRERDVTIANLNREIAGADAELAGALLRFQSVRFLNTEFWSGLANLMKRVMRRYIELGARYAWLAERALAYEQDRSVNIIRFDYFPARFQGVSGADLLQSDLAELEASRLEGLKQTVPVKHTFSLACDFPFHFARLKKEGRCTFRTEELPFRYAHPGVHGLRVRGVTVAVQTVGAVGPVRGLLRNEGFSLVSRSDGESHPSVRRPEALPLSEFRLADDWMVYGLTDESLMTFEGSGVDTFWTMEFPNVANQFGLERVADIRVTVDARANFSPELYEKHLAEQPKTVRRLLFFSAAKHQPQAVLDLQSSDPQHNVVDVKFDLPAAGLPPKEANRKVKNVVLLAAGEKPLTFKANFYNSKAPVSNVQVTIEDGVAMSNLPPLSVPGSNEPPSPLNVFGDKDAGQLFALTITKSENPGVDFSKASDVVLGVEYTADLQP